MGDPETDPVLMRAFAELRELPADTDLARARLRRALAEERMPQRRVVVVSRTRVIVAACVLAVLASLSLLVVTRDAPTALADGRSPVQFVLVAPDAHTVSIAGDFNGWDASATPLRRDGGGVWSIVLRLDSGTFAYSFVVDGNEWRADPAAAVATDDFGRPSSVVLVTAET